MPPFRRSCISAAVTCLARHTQPKLPPLPIRMGNISSTRLTSAVSACPTVVHAHKQFHPCTQAAFGCFIVETITRRWVMGGVRWTKPRMVSRSSPTNPQIALALRPWSTRSHLEHYDHLECDFYWRPNTFGQTKHIHLVPRFLVPCRFAYRSRNG